MKQVLSLLLAFDAMTRKSHDALLSRLSRPTLPLPPVVKRAEKVGAPDDQKDFLFPRIETVDDPRYPAALVPGGERE